MLVLSLLLVLLLYGSNTTSSLDYTKPLLTLSNYTIVMALGYAPGSFVVLRYVADFVMVCPPPNHLMQIPHNLDNPPNHLTQIPP